MILVYLDRAQSQKVKTILNMDGKKIMAKEKLGIFDSSNKQTIKRHIYRGIDK